MTSTEGIFTQTTDVLDGYANDSTSRADLLQNGIHLSVVQEAVRYAMAGFQPIQLGFGKFIEYMQFVCKGSDFFVSRFIPT